MNDFERTAVVKVVDGTMIAPEVSRQLPYVDVKERVHRADGRVVTFVVDADAPRIFPQNADLAADLVIAGVGPTEASVIVREGQLRALVIPVPVQDWPEAPVVLGRAD